MKITKKFLCEFCIYFKVCRDIDECLHENNNCEKKNAVCLNKQVKMLKIATQRKTTKKTVVDCLYTGIPYVFEINRRVRTKEN